MISRQPNSAPVDVTTDFQKMQRVTGATFGQAIGDAIGHPVEFGASFGKTPPEFKKGNRFTDDTQMMVAIAEALLETPPHLHGTEPFMVTLGKHFVAFEKDPFGGGHRAPGGACMSGCRALRGGAHWKNSGGTSQKGNGAAMRSSVVGSYYHRLPELAWRVGCLTAVPTHNNLEAIVTAGAVSMMVANAINGIPWQENVLSVALHIRDYAHTVPYYPQNVPVGYGYNDQNPVYASNHLAVAFLLGKTHMPQSELRFNEFNGNDFATVPAVAAAVFYNTRYSSFRDITYRCAANTGDADTTTAIAGAIAGARLGANFIPKEWRTDVEQSAYFEKLSQRLWAASQAVEAETIDTEIATART